MVSIQSLRRNSTRWGGLLSGRKFLILFTTYSLVLTLISRSDGYKHSTALKCRGCTSVSPDWTDVVDNKPCPIQEVEVTCPNPDRACAIVKGENASTYARGCAPDGDRDRPRCDDHWCQCGKELCNVDWDTCCKHANGQLNGGSGPSTKLVLSKPTTMILLIILAEAIYQAV